MELTTSIKLTMVQTVAVTTSKSEVRLLLRCRAFVFFCVVSFFFSFFFLSFNYNPKAVVALARNCSEDSIPLRSAHATYIDHDRSE